MRLFIFSSVIVFTFFFFQSFVIASGPGDPDGSSLGLGTFSKPVHVVKTQPDGKILVGGDFAFYRTLPVNRLIRLTAGGLVDETFDTGLGANGRVKSIALQHDGKILVGGEFTTFNGISNNRVVRLNSDGSIDETFDTGTGANGHVNSIVVQPDGKILIGGEFTTFNGASKNRLVRLTTNGSIDDSFISTGANDDVNSIVLNPDGKILVGGAFDTFNGASHMRLTRLNANGSIDSSFNVGSGASSRVNTVTVQEDQKILVGGYFTSFNGVAKKCLVRLNSDGSIDDSFDIGAGANIGDVYSIVIHQDNKIIIGGQFTAFNGVALNSLARLNVDGSIDPTFNIGSGATGSVTSTVVLNEGKILVGGWFTGYNNKFSNRMVRLNVDGSLDNTFQNESWGANGTVFQIVEQEDHKLIVGGDFTSFNGVVKKYLVRLNTDGSIDESFKIGSGPNGVIRAIVLQADGKILLGGKFTAFNGITQNRFARLHQDGTIDNDFTIGTAANSNIYAIALQPDKKIVVGGDFTSFNGVSKKGLVRLHADGAVDQTFNTGTGAGSSSGGSALVQKITLQPDGKILIGGNFNVYNGSSSQRYFLRLNEDASVDNTFDIGTGVNGTVSSILVLKDGKIIVAGALDKLNGENVSSLCRLRTDGSIDNTFDVGTGSNARSGITELVLLPDDKLLVGGWFTYFNGSDKSHLVRLHGDGAVDETFEVGSGANACVFALNRQSDGKILIGGSFTSYNGISANHIVRLNGDTSVVSGLESYSVSTDSDINVYPNPSVGVFTIESLSPNTKLEIMTIDGVLERTLQLGGSLQQEINLEGISSGIYLYMIWKGENLVHTGRLLID